MDNTVKKDAGYRVSAEGKGGGSYSRRWYSRRRSGKPSSTVSKNT